MDNSEFQFSITPQSVFFFDMDGTLIETTTANNFAYKQSFETIMGYAIPISATYRITHQIIRKLPSISPEDLDRIVEEKKRIYSSNLALTQPIQFTVNVLKNYSVSNKTYLVTKSSKERAIETLSYHGLIDSFTTIISSCAENKFEDAITFLGIDAHDILLFENEDEEIQKGMAAGILKNNIIQIRNGKI